MRGDLWGSRWGCHLMLFRSCGALSDPCSTNSRIWETKAPLDFSVLFMMFSQLTLQEWGPALGGSSLGHPLSGGAGGEVQVLFVWLECRWVTEISSGLSGIMKLPCQVSGCPGGQGYDSYYVSLKLFGSFNCLLFNIPWNVNLERIHIHKGDFKKIKGIYSNLRNLVFLCVCMHIVK